MPVTIDLGPNVDLWRWARISYEHYAIYKEGVNSFTSWEALSLQERSAWYTLVAFQAILLRTGQVPVLPEENIP